MYMNKHIDMKKLLLLTATLSAFSAGNPIALGQGGGEVAPDIEEIIVTSRRREERLLDTPMSVNVFSGDLLRTLNIARIDEISHYTPGLVFDTTTTISGSASSASVFIRGIGQTDFTLVTEPGVGIYIDDIYLTHSIGNVVDALDIERVEVLKGPQGTLFGRNTIGGAIRVVTKKPHAEWGGDVEVVMGEYDRIDVKGHINVPVSDNLAFRFSALTQNWDGFVDRPRLSDTTGDKDTGIFVVQGRYDTDRFTADLMWSTVRDRSNGAPNVLLAAGEGAGNQNTAIATGLADALGGQAADYFWNEDRLPAGCSAKNADKCLVDNTDLKLNYDLDISSLGLTLDWDLGGSMSLKSISSYRSLETHFGRDGDHSAIPVISVDSFIDVASYSQELQLSGALDSNQSMQWLVGLYYFNEDGFMDDDVRFNNFSLLSGGDVETESTSAFGQITWAASAQVELTLGVRYTDESKTFSMDAQHQVAAFSSAGGDAIGWLDPNNVPTYGFKLAFRDPNKNVDATTGRVIPSICSNVSDTIFECEAEEDQVDYHANVAWSFRPDRLAYISYSTGFKGGGFQQRNANLPDLPLFGPEEARVTEIGYKADLFQRRLRLTTAYFRTDYTNLQVTVTEGAGEGVSVTRNAGDATISGFEAEVVTRLANGLQLAFSLATLDGEYDSLSPAAIKAGVTKDKDLPRVPKIQTAFSISYEAKLGGTKTLTPRLGWSHSDKMYNDAGNSQELERRSYDLIDLTLTYLDRAQDLSLSLFIKNATDEQFVTSGFYGTPSPSAPLEYVDGSISRPSEYGLSIRKGF